MERLWKYLTFKVIFQRAARGPLSWEKARIGQIAKSPKKRDQVDAFAHDVLHWLGVGNRSPRQPPWHLIPVWHPNGSLLLRLLERKDHAVI